MRFWDSSALIPLLLPEASTVRMQQLVQGSTSMVVWHWTIVEVTSALERRSREGAPAVLIDDAKRRLEDLSQRWTEILEHEVVRARARRCLRIHPLRAADAGHLAAALYMAGRQAALLEFVTLDQRLAAAARLEGMSVLP